MKILIGKGNISLDEIGCIVAINADENSAEKSIYPANSHEPFIQIGFNGELLKPIALTQNANTLMFNFDNAIDVSIAYSLKDTHTVFEVTQISGKCENITFGPIPSTIDAIIGEVIGVVRDDNYAFGIQSLDMKTLPGFPPYKDKKYAKFASELIMSQISVGSCDYYGNAAFKVDGGSILQLYCENRRIERKKKVQNIENVHVSSYDNSDADIIGAKFALFCCVAKDALETIGKIEIAEGLAHPIMDGEWAKTARTAMRSYFISEFDVNDIDEMLDYTIKGGFRELYHPEPFSTWGHFDLRKEKFPNGDSDLAYCSKKAKERGVGIGVHTLSNFTTTNDAYVTPIPSKNLAKLATVILTQPVTCDDTSIILDNAAIFENPTFLTTVQIDDELIQFGGVDKENNTLNNCTRGAFGTSKSTHKAQSDVYFLSDHGYKVFYPDIILQDKFCDRLVELFNKCDLMQISFDGLEGCRYCGEDEYAVNRFCDRCYQGFNNEVINDASQLNHNLWHMNTRMNWGEPWGEKMRTGMIDYRMRNQEYFAKNLFPRMLGWFLIRSAERKFEASTLDDIEWALSEAAGFDAGFAFFATKSTLDKLGNSDAILEAVKTWEQLRISNAFTDELKAKLKKPETEWHLEKNPENEAQYLLYPADMSQQFSCDLSEMQPGQAGGSDWSYTNKFEKQEYKFKIRVIGDGYIENPFITTKSGTVKIPCKAKGGQYIIYNGNGNADITDKNYNVIESVKTVGVGMLENGQQALSFTCEHGGEEEPEAQLSVYTYGVPFIL